MYIAVERILLAPVGRQDTVEDRVDTIGIGDILRKQVHRAVHVDGE
jgi:hypothetical protein